MLVYVRTVVTAIFVMTEEDIRESKNSNPKGGARAKEGKRGGGDV